MKPATLTFETVPRPCSSCGQPPIISNSNGCIMVVCMNPRCKGHHMTQTRAGREQAVKQWNDRHAQ